MLDIKKIFYLALIFIAEFTNMTAKASENPVLNPAIIVNSEQQMGMIGRLFKGEYTQIGNKTYIFNTTAQNQVPSFIPTTQNLPHVTLGILLKGVLSFHVTTHDKRTIHYILDYSKPVEASVSRDPRTPAKGPFEMHEEHEIEQLAHDFAKVFHSRKVIREYNSNWHQ